MVPLPMRMMGSRRRCYHCYRLERSVVFLLHSFIGSHTSDRLVDQTEDPSNPFDLIRSHSTLLLYRRRPTLESIGCLCDRLEGTYLVVVIEPL